MITHTTTSLPKADANGSKPETNGSESETKGSEFLSKDTHVERDVHDAGESTSLAGDTFSALPRVLFGLIGNHMKPSNLSAAMRACKSWHRGFNDPENWRRWYGRDFNGGVVPQGLGVSWKELY